MSPTPASGKTWNPWEPAEVAPLLVAISGPSGVGKDTLIDKLLESEPRMRKVATVTTRPPRPGEVQGIHHYFVSPERFQQLIAEGALLEHARVYDNWYGVPRADVDKLIGDGWDVILRTDIQGVASIKALAPHALTIFIAPVDMADLEARLRRRGGAETEDRALRLETARREMEAARTFDHVVVNPEYALDSAVESVRRILAKERSRP